jgi:hypothetical protein
MASGPLLHIGFHKTGTSWLQRHAFRSEALGFATAGSEERIKERLVAPHDLDFDPAACRAVFAPRIEKALAAGLVPVLSAERLCGDMTHGGYDSARLASRLASVWPDGRVLIVIREQRQMVFSSYSQYVKMGGLLDLEAYLHRPPLRSPHPWPFVLAHLQYDRLIAHYRQLFGEANVLVLPYELFRHEPDDFVRRLSSFAGARSAPGAIESLPFDRVVNVGEPAAALPITRRANFFLRRRLNPWAPLDAKTRVGRSLSKGIVRVARTLPRALDARVERQMQAAIAEAVGRRYRESNARTSELIGLDLAQYGYDVPDAGSARVEVGSAADRVVEPVAPG